MESQAWELGSLVCRILPVLLLMGTGQLLRMTRYLQPAAVAGMKKLAINIGLPLVIFLSLLELELKRAYLALPLAVFAISVLLLLTGMRIRRGLGVENPYFPALYTSYENGMMGYGVLAVVFGQANIYPIVILDIGQTLFFSLVFVAWMGVLNGKASSPKAVARNFLMSPYVWATVAALALNLTGVRGLLEASASAGAALEGMGLLAGITTPVMCLVVGYELKVNWRNLEKPLAASLSRTALLLCVAAAFDQLVVKRLLELDHIFTVAVYTMFLLPPFFVGALLIKEEAEEEEQFALNVISLNIILFLLLFPPVMAWLGK